MNKYINKLEHAQNTIKYDNKSSAFLTLRVCMAVTLLRKSHMDSFCCCHDL